MGNSWWSSPFGLRASKHFITCRAHLKPFDRVTSEVAVSTCTAIHTADAKGKDGEQSHPVLVAPQVGFAGQQQQEKQNKAKQLQKTETETTAGQRPLILPWEVNNISYKSLLCCCQDRATWELAAGYSPCLNLVQGLLSAFYSTGNYPGYIETTQTTQNKGIHSSQGAVLTKQVWHQASTTKPQAAVHGDDLHKQQESGEIGVMDQLRALRVLMTVFHRLKT